MIFAGPPGTGKTCCAIAIARELFGDSWRQNFQETNASDMRGIDVIRTRIKNFSRTKPIGSTFKIIFLDEGDALTSDAQNALRRLMEMYADVTRFIISCNYSSNLIAPIQSRAAVFRFKFLSKDNVLEYLERIVKSEKIKIDKDALEAVYEISEGDLRKATNILQASAMMKKKITKDVIYEVAAQAEPDEVKKMINLSLKGKFLDSREILKDMLLKRGISGQDIIKQISSQIYSLDISDTAKACLIEKVGDFEFRMQTGNELIQLEALLAQFTVSKK
jgi:replication factor C small subunit